MSKMSWLHATLTEQAAELGFRSIEEAQDNGYSIDYDNKELIKLDEQELAHEAWLKEKEELLEKLRYLKKMEEYSKELMSDEYLGLGEIEIMDCAIKFIEGVKYE